MIRAIALLLLVLLVSAAAPSAWAGEYTLGFFANYEATSCELLNTEPEVITIHMLLYGDAATANTAAFYAPTPDCWDAVWLGDEINDDYIFLGSTHGQYGISVTFRACRDLPVRLGSMSFFASGSQPCCTYEAFPQPEGHTGIIEAITCDLRTVAADYESTIINPDASCSCTASSVVSTEETTWGEIKALYQ